jgi:hypothetical protein
LNDFKDFAVAFDAKARELAEQDKVFKSLSEKEKENFHVWLDEKINKALDIYWAPLSQAATQYVSPAYKNQLENLKSLEPQIKGFLETINQFSGTSGEAAITINDLLLFFDDLTLIRIAPYTRTALIGIPFRVFDSDSSNDHMLAGIAHELGHFLYWRLDDFSQLYKKHNEILGSIRESLKNKFTERQQLGIRFINAWFEELFADFIGANIAKDIYIKSSKDMVIRSNKLSSKSGSNDQKHVADILRPLVGIHTVNKTSENSLDNWRKFLNDEFPVDPSTIMIRVIRENKNQRDIERSAEELSQILLDTIDEFKNAADNGLFRPHFSNIANVEILSEKAILLASNLSDKNRHAVEEAVDVDNEFSALDIFLEPQILEAGEQSHSHIVSTPAHTYSFTAWHTHS